MKTYIIRLIFSILSVLSIDQCRSQDPTKFSADLSCGPSIPFGNFANKNYSTVPNSNGLAKLGFSIYANLKYKFSGHFGISLAAESSFNKQDPAAISNYTNNGAVYPIDTRIVTDDWRLFKILAGFYYQGFFNNKKLSYVFSILGGASKTSTPSYYWAVYTQSGSLNTEQQQNSLPLPWSFAYQTGAGIQYDMKNNVYFLFSADYFNSSSKLTTSNLRYDFGSVNIMAGAGIRF